MIRILEPWGRGFREFLPSLRTAFEFYARFPDETSCRDFLFVQRFPTGFTCSSCGGTAFRWLSSKHLRCRRPHCRHKTSLTAGTILHGSHKPLHLWFRAAFNVAQFGTNARELQRRLKLTYKVAWAWCHKLRRVMSAKTTLDAPFPPFDRIGRQRQDLPVNAVAQKHHFFNHGNFLWDVGRPGGLGECCERLMKPDWDLEPGPGESPAIRTTTAYNWLFRDYSGSLSDKHLRAYFDETEFRWNHRSVPPFESATELIERFAWTKPYPYRAITGLPAKRDVIEFQCFAGPRRAVASTAG